MSTPEEQGAPVAGGPVTTEAVLMQNAQVLQYLAAQGMQPRVPSAPKIELKKFSGEASGWSAWNFSLSTLLGVYGLGPKVEQQANGQAVEFTPEENVTLRQIFGAVVGALSGEALSIAQSSSTGTSDGADLAAIIQGLHAFYNSQSRSVRLDALKKLLNEKIRQNESMESFLREKNRIMKESLANSLTPDDILVSSVLLNVPQKYLSTVTTLLTNGEPTFQDISRVLIEAERADRSMNSTKESDEHNAMLVDDVGPPPRGPKEKGTTRTRPTKRPRRT